MKTLPKLIFAFLPVALVGCASVNPTGAFEDVNKEVAARAGQEIRWMRTDAERGEMEKAVEALLQTNLTAQAAVSIALLNNRSLQAEFEGIGISQADLAQSSRLSNPQFSGSWRSPFGSGSGVNAEYSLAQNFLDLLFLPTRKRVAAQNLAGAKLRIADGVLKLSQEVQAAFYTLQAHQQFARRLAVIVEVNEAVAEIAQRQFNAGNIHDLELQNQKAAFAQARLDFAKAETQTRMDREKLNRLLGLWGNNTAWQVTDELPALAEKEITLENLEAVAVNRRLDLAVARGELAVFRGALQLQKNFRFVPGATVGFEAERELDHSWIAGPTLNLELPIFDQGQAAMAKLSGEYRRAQRSFEALAVNIRSEVRESRDALIAARDAAEYYAKILLPLRQQILSKTLLQYNAMQVSSIELLAAKEREQLAEREAIEALKDYWIARSEIERAIGGLLSDATRMSAPAKTDAQETEHEKHNH